VKGCKEKNFSNHGSQIHYKFHEKIAEGKLKELHIIQHIDAVFLHFDIYIYKL